MSNVEQKMGQMRAKFALDRIKILAKKSSSDKKELCSYVNNLSSMIRTNGLGQALAFYNMKKGNHLTLYCVVSDWLCGQGTNLNNKNIHIFKKHDDALDAIVASDMKTYMCAQNEALELLEWLIKFATAFLKE